MALPAMITGFGEQSANYGAVVGQSLQQLGQQVGQQLAMREYQKQAAAALPAMQSSFQSALSKIQSGDVSDGYIDLLNTQMQFGSTTNPFIQSAMANFSDLALKAGEMKKSELFRQAQYGGGTGGGTLPAMGPSGADQARAALMGQPMAQDIQAGGAEMLPEGSIEGELPQGDAGMGEPTLTPGEPGFTQEPDEVQIDAANAAAQAVDATPEMQTKAVNALVADPKDSKIQWQNDKIEGLSALFPKSNLTDNIAIAPVGSTVEYSETWSGDTNKAGARFSGNKQVKVDDALNKKAVEYAGKLQESVSKLYNTGPVDTDQTWADVIKDAGGIQNLIPASAGADDFSIRIKGKESLPVNKDTFEAFERVKGFSAFASRTGIKVMRDGGEPPAAAPAPAAGEAATAPAAAPGAAPTAAGIPTAPDNPFATAAQKETTARAAATEKKTKEARQAEIKRLTDQMQRLAPPPTAGLMALETGGAQGLPGVMQDPAQQAKLKEQYDALYYRRDRLIAQDEGRVFATPEEAKASKKKFPKGTIIYIGNEMATVK